MNKETVENLIKDIEVLRLKLKTKEDELATIEKAMSSPLYGVLCEAHDFGGVLHVGYYDGLHSLYSSKTLKDEIYFDGHKECIEPKRLKPIRRK